MKKILKITSLVTNGTTYRENIRIYINSQQLDEEIPCEIEWYDQNELTVYANGETSTLPLETIPNKPIEDEKGQFSFYLVEVH